MAYYEVMAWDSRYANYYVALAAGAATGRNNEFTMTAGTSIAYVPVNGGGNSTWTAVGNDSLLYINWIPEPSAFALAAFAAVVLVVLRRTNSSNS